MIQGQFQLQQGEFHFNVNFSFPNQGITVIFGHSGSGKTTLLRCIAGLIRAEGCLKINGEIWQDEQIFLPTHQRPVGYVFQEPSLFMHLNVEKNLHYGMKRVPITEQKVQLDNVVELLGITRFLKRHPKNLSGGEKQRVAIARALLTSPKILLMDEPLAALDIHSKAEILPYLEKLHAELSIPVLYISHSLQEVKRLADYLMIMKQGEITEHGKATNMLSHLDSLLKQVGWHDSPFVGF